MNMHPTLRSNTSWGGLGRGAIAVASIVVLIAACGGSDEASDDSGYAALAQLTDEEILQAEANGSAGNEKLTFTPPDVTLTRIGGYAGGAAGAAEISAYDPGTRRLFVVNGANGTVDVMSLENPASPALVQTLSVADVGSGVNSVAIGRGVAALAVQAANKTDPGVVLLVDTRTLSRKETLTVGALPDMLTFTPNGRHLLVANEGEPNSYGFPDSVDPEGSISVIEVNPHGQSVVRTADFRAFIGQEDALRAKGVRIFGPGANAAQDFEPESITVSADGRTAWVSLQENNAVAVVDIFRARVTAVHALGWKDHNVAGAGLDASDEDGGTNTNSGTPKVNIVPQPVRGLYMPDAIASYRVLGFTFLITANEGDARADWPGFNEEVRVRAHCDKGFDATVFGAAASTMGFDSNLGRLRVTNAPFGGGYTSKNAAGQCTELYSFGARSFSIWSPNMTRVFDSGDAFEQRTRALPNVLFNASNDNNTLDSRSPSKGPEPEGVVVGRVGLRQYAFIGLERVGGVMVYDVSNPFNPRYVTYVNTREGATGDRGPEGLSFIAAHESPHGKPLLVVSNEVSGTTAIFEIALQYGSER